TPGRGAARRRGTGRGADGCSRGRGRYRGGHRLRDPVGGRRWGRAVRRERSGGSVCRRGVACGSRLSPVVLDGVADGDEAGEEGEDCGEAPPPLSGPDPGAQHGDADGVEDEGGPEGGAGGSGFVHRFLRRSDVWGWLPAIDGWGCWEPLEEGGLPEVAGGRGRPSSVLGMRRGPGWCCAGMPNPRVVRSGEIGRAHV